MNNVITYVAPKIKTMAHSMILNNKISCVVGISIFGFKKYWQRVFNLMWIKTTPSFKYLLQVEKLNAEENKSYYQWYDVKRLRAFHKQSMVVKIMRTYLQGGVGWTIVQGYCCKNSHQNGQSKGTQDEQLTMKINGQKKRCRCVSLEHLCITSKEFPIGISY